MSESTITVTIIEDGTESTVSATRGDLLLEVLHHFGKPIHAPCGGKGKCRKCTASIAGEGEKLCCEYRVDHAIEVTLPQTRRPQILHAGYQGHLNIELDAGFTEFRSGDSVELLYRGMPCITRPVDHDGRRFGIAVDIGTTTVVLYLVDLVNYVQIDVASFINPQVRHGHDVVSRIQFAMADEGNLDRLRGLLIDQMNHEIAQMCTRLTIAAGDIIKLTFAGNPTMLHILCGVRPDSIAAAPYTPVFTERRELTAAELGIGVNPAGVAVVLPSVSGYVGADITAGTAATPLTDNEGMSLFIDIGTNGEMALGNRDRLFCCATAAGPAFEGATIACGVGGVEGAISVYTADGIATIGNAKPVGICGSGLVDITAYLLDRGLIDEGGYLADDVTIVPASQTENGAAIVLTPLDVRQVQLAKAAIAAGIRVMLDEAGVTLDQIGTLYLGGAFGNYMNINRAARIGLIPEALAERVVATGNIAGRGATLALMSVGFEKRVDAVAASMRYLELSTHPAFTERYVEEMGFRSRV